MNNLLESSFIIHSRDYGETSVIYDVLTENYGFMSVLAKGIKKKKDGLLLLPFRELLLSYTKANLPLLVKHEVSNDYSKINRNFMLYGLYYNELIYRLVPKNEPLKSMYSLYKSQLNYMVSDIDVSVASLRFEYLFLKEIGYGLSLSDELNGRLNDNDTYYYDFNSGFKKSYNNTNDKICGTSLLNLANNNFSKIKDVKVLRQIIREVFKKLLNNKSLKSFDIIN
tara:strand:+ start:715 stop:1389 length:675 start_codon:yes stop_codon:yes gene_type:complete